MALRTLMKPIAPAEAATVLPKVAKLLLLTFKMLVGLAEPDGYVMPFIAPVVNPVCREMLLLLMVFVNVVVGVADAAGICMPFKVPTVTPPTELVTVLKETLKPFEFLTRIPLTVPETFA